MMDAILEPMSNALGQPMDQTKYVFCLLLGFPLSFVYRALPKNRTVRNLFSIITGLGFCIFCLGPWSWVHSFFTAAVTYLLVRFGPVGISHKIVFVFCMAYMSFSHLYRMYTDYLGWSLDYTGPQMVLTLKLTSFAWSYYDGTRPKEELPKELLERRITKLPGLIEYFGWVYFFPAFLAGPAIELHHYVSFMDGSLFGEKKTAGSTILPGLKVIAMALCCAPLTVLSGFFPPTYFLTEAFRAEPLWLKAARAYFHAAPLRGKYYVAWFLAEAGCVGTGIAYNPKAPGAHDTLRNCHPLNVEFGTNFREIINSWNIATSNWLRHYVYMRTTKNGKPTAYSTFITYVVSAFWHGFYPGYYLFFIGGAIATELSKPARRIFRKYFVTADDKPIYPRKFFYDIITMVVSQWFLCYLALAFALLSVENALTAWASLYYAPIIIAVALLFILPVFDRPVRKEAVQKKVQ